MVSRERPRSAFAREFAQSHEALRFMLAFAPSVEADVARGGARHRVQSTPSVRSVYKHRQAQCLMPRAAASVHTVLKHPCLLTYDSSHAAFRRHRAPHNDLEEERVTPRSCVPRARLYEQHFFTAMHIKLLRMGICVHAQDVALLCGGSEAQALRCDVLASVGGCIVLVFVCASAAGKGGARAHARRFVHTARRLLITPVRMRILLLLWDRWDAGRQIVLCPCSC